MPENCISVIIPVYNEERTIRRLLNSVKERQLGLIKEVIVVDSGSHDNTVKAAEESGAQVIQGKVKGRASQMNEGASAASGEILYFLHADSLPPVNFDLHIINAIAKNHIAGCFKLRFDDPNPLLKFFAAGSRLKTTLVRFGDQSLFVKRRAFEMVGGFDESLTVMEDQEIVRDLKKVGSFKLLNDHVITSARKYKTIGIFKLQVVFTLIWLGYYLGISQEILVHFYKSILNQSSY